MFDDLRDLYSAEIRAHGRQPRHARRLQDADATARGDNPMCGDRVQVWLRRSGDAVAALGFEARGCELTIASADLMCEAATGRTADDVRALLRTVEAVAGEQPGDQHAGDPGRDALVVHLDGGVLGQDVATERDPPVPDRCRER